MNLVVERRGTIDKAEITLVDVIKQSVAPELLEHRLVLAQCDEVRYNRFVGDDKIAAIHRAVDGGLDALFKVGNQIARVAAENLVAALPAEYDLAARRSQLRHHVLRK